MALVKDSDRALRHACRECGRAGSELYWAKDTDKPDTRRGRSWSYVLVDKTPETFSADKGDTLPESARHACKVNRPEPGDRMDVNNDDEAFAPTPTPVAVQGAPDAAALDALRQLLSPRVDPAVVEEIVRRVLGDVAFPVKTVTVVNGERRELEDGEVSHKSLASVVRTLGRRGHVLMVGPAGSGKSTIARQAATMLDLPFYSQSCYPQMPPSALVGYSDANGNFHDTAFIRAFKTGGVFCLDELDNSHSSTLNLLNEALANGHMQINHEMVAKSPDFVLAGTANTYGKGASREYVGRQAIDAATLDRFVVKTIDYDEALEAAACKATGANQATIDKVLRFTRAVRKVSDEQGLRVIVSPRASIAMCHELHAGADWDEAVDECVRKGVSADVWQKLT